MGHDNKQQIAVAYTEGMRAGLRTARTWALSRPDCPYTWADGQGELALSWVDGFLDGLALGMRRMG